MSRTIRLHHAVGGRWGRMRHFLAMAVLLCISGTALRAESPRQDSLRRVSTTYLSDTSALRSMIRLAQTYYGSNLDSAVAIAGRARTAAEALHFDDLLADAENTSGIARLFQGNNREALAHFEAVLRIRERQKNTGSIARALNNVALAHQELGNTVLALDYHIRSLKLKEELGDSSSIRISYNNIGLIYEQLNDYGMARNYYRKALDFMPIKQDTMAHATNWFNIGVTYFMEEKNDSAEYSFRQSLPLVEGIGDQRMIGLHHLQFGVLRQRAGDYQGAEVGIRKALEIFRELGKLDQVAAALSFLGMNYLNTGEPARARDLCEEALRLARETENRGKASDCLNCLHQSYHALGRPAEAYRYAMQYYRLRDSLSTDGVHQQIVRKDLEYSYKKQQLADSMATARNSEMVRFSYENELKRQETLTLFLVVVGTLLLGLAILFYANFRQKKRQGAILEERVRLRTSELEKQRDQLGEYAFINAHMLRHPLTQIMGLIPLIQNAQTPEEREMYLDLLEKASQKLDGVIHEIRDVVEVDRGS